MANGATSRGHVFLNLSLLVLLNFLGTTLSTGIDSLSCSFIVKYRTSPGQCSVNGKPFLHFGDGKQEGNAPEVCADLPQSLKDIFDKMTNLESGLFKSKGNHTLQVNIKSQYSEGEFIDGLWAFSIDGQYTFYFYPKNMTWNVSHADAIGIMRHWKNNRELVQSLRTLSRADFSHCLKKLTYSIEMPGSTRKVLNTTQPIYATQNQPTENINQHISDSQGLSITWKVILPIAVPFIISIFAFAFYWYRRNKKLKQKKKSEPPLHSNVGDDYCRAQEAGGGRQSPHISVVRGRMKQESPHERTENPRNKDPNTTQENLK